MFHLTNYAGVVVESTAKASTIGSVIIVASICVATIAAWVLFNLSYLVAAYKRYKVRKIYWAQEKEREREAEAVKLAAMSAIDAENLAKEKRREKIEWACLGAAWLVGFVGSLSALIIGVYM